MNTRKLWIIWIIVPIMLLVAGAGAAFTIMSTTNPVALAAANPQTAQATASPVGDLTALENLYEQIYAKVNPSVVNIQVVMTQTAANPNDPRNPFGNQGPSMALASGFVWDTQGDIVTNNHVVANADRITVSFSDGTTVDAKLVGTDPYSDLAVIKVSVSSSHLIPMELADSTQAKVGQIVIAIGNPFGFQGTMTQGIISALGRMISSADNANAQPGPQYNIPDIIQTDASINPGNSGGVLVDTNGQLIGVTSAIESTSGTNSGVGFAIPSAIVQKEVPTLIKTGTYQHAWMGISGASLFPDLAKAMNLKDGQQGALIVTVTAGGPAAKAGLQPSNQQVTINGEPYPVGGDVITAINGQSVKQFDDLISYLFNSTEVGQTVNLTILRQGQEKQVTLTLGVRPAQ